MSARQADLLGAVALWALAALQLAWPGRSALGLVIALVPLLPALGLWLRAPRRGLLLGALVGLGYFCHGVMEAWTVPALRLPGGTEALLEVALVGALGFATRIEKQQHLPPTR